MYVQACFTSGNTAKVIIGNRKNSQDAPLLRDLIKDTQLLIEEEAKKALAPDGFELGVCRPLL